MRSPRLLLRHALARSLALRALPTAAQRRIASVATAGAGAATAAETTPETGPDGPQLPAGLYRIQKGSGGATLRSMPSANAPAVLAWLVPEGAQVTVLDRFPVSNFYAPVSYGGQAGWISTTVLVPVSSAPRLSSDDTIALRALLIAWYAAAMPRPLPIALSPPYGQLPTDLDIDAGQARQVTAVQAFQAWHGPPLVVTGIVDEPTRRALLTWIDRALGPDRPEYRPGSTLAQGSGHVHAGTFGAILNNAKRR